MKEEITDVQKIEEVKGTEEELIDGLTFYEDLSKKCKKQKIKYLLLTGAMATLAILGYSWFILTDQENIAQRIISIVSGAIPLGFTCNFASQAGIWSGKQSIANKEIKKIKSWGN